MSIRPLRLLALLAALIVALVGECVTPNAIVKVAVASLRSGRAHSAEMETQALMGTPVYLHESAGLWRRATLPDGYVAYINESAVCTVGSSKFERWRTAERLICVSPFETHIFEKPDEDSDVVSDFVMGCIVEGRKNDSSAFVSVTLPDGRSGYVKQETVEPFYQWMTRPFDARRVVAMAKKLMGCTYLWGGRSTKGVDCSGLSQLTYFDSGILLPRNASQQALCGTPATKYIKGDLLFFQNEKGKVTHVAIYDENSIYVHSSGRVKLNSMNPKSAIYSKRKVNFGRRVSGEKKVISHPWYF